MTKPDLRGEFEKAFDKEYGVMFRSDRYSFDAALWAARWMAERCAKEAESFVTGYQADTALRLRQLAKELS